MREIVTLQFGEEANYLGTHFWNIQARSAKNAMLKVVAKYFLGIIFHLFR